MTVAVSNTNLNDSFNTWRLNTNFAATVISNNVVTVSRDGSANRGGVAKGNGHVAGTFTANELRTVRLHSGNTSNEGNFIQIASNTSINATSFTVTANATFQGNVNFATSGTDRIIMGDISRIRVTGGSQGQFLRIGTQTDTPDFKALTLRDISDLSTNSAHIILSGSNATFSDTGDSHALILSAGGGQRAYMFMSANSTLSDKADVFLQLSDDTSNATFTITNASNTEQFTVRADGTVYAVANVTATGFTTDGNILPIADDSVDIGAPNREFRNAYFDGTVTTDILTVATGATQGVSASLIPVTDAVSNLGSSTRKWGTVWADTTNGGAGVFSGLGVSGNLNANGNLTVTGSISTSNTLAVTGTSTFAESATFSANASFSDEVVVSGNTSLNGDVTLGDASTDTITVKGNFANQSTNGLAQFNGSVDLGNQSSDTLTITAKVDSNFIPVTNDGVGRYDIGATATRWHNVYANNTFSNNITTDNNITVKGNLTVEGSTSFAANQTFAVSNASFGTLNVTGVTTLDGDVDLGDTDGDTVTFNGLVDSNILPTGTRNLGSASAEWNNAWFTGTVKTDLLTVDETSTFTGAVDINNNVDISGNLSNDGTKIISNNGEIFANNAIGDDNILNSMILNDHVALATNGTGADFDVALGETLNINEGEGINVTLTANTVTIAAEEASTSNKGVASFSTDNFSVSSGVVTIKDGGIASAEIANTMNLGAGGVVHGSASQVPIIRVNKQGQVIGISNTSVAGVSSFTYTSANNDLKIGTATGVTYNATINSATANTDGSNGGLTNRGVASFDSGDFTVSSGLVSLKNATTGAVLAINGTTDEVVVSRSNGTVTVGLPDDVTVAGQLNVSENLVVGGNLVVSGTVTSVETTQLKVSNTYVVLNGDLGGGIAPSEDAGLIVNRGSSANVEMQWDESTDRWTFTNDGSTYYNIPISSEYDNYSSWSIQDGNANTSSQTLTSGQTLTVAQGNGIDSTLTGTDQLKITNIKPFDNIVMEDGDGTQVTVTNQKYIKFVEAAGDGASININWTDTSDGTSGDPYDLSFDVTNDDKGSDQNIFKTIAVTDTDSGYTWAETGSVVADTNSDTVTFVSGTGVDIDADATNDAIRIEIGQAVGTTDDVQFANGQFDSLGVGTAASGTTGEIRATNDIVAHYSDERLKVIEGTIPDALEKVKSLSGFYFTENETAKELGYNNDARQVGVSAQAVQDVLPEIVKNAPIDDKYLTVQYEKLVPLLIEAIKELSDEVEKLRNQ